MRAWRFGASPRSGVPHLAVAVEVARVSRLVPGLEGAYSIGYPRAAKSSRVRRSRMTRWRRLLAPNRATFVGTKQPERLASARVSKECVMRERAVLRYGARLAATVLVVVLAAPVTVEAVGSTVASPSSDVAAPSPIDGGAIDTFGIPLVSTLVQATPTDESQAQAISDAVLFAQNHPDDVGYPWADPATGELVLSAATATGSALLDEWAASRTVSTSVRQVSTSFGELEAIKDQVTHLQAAGVPDADLIHMTGPDPETNRVAVVVSAPSPSLFQALADRFGTQAIELRIDASMLGAQPGYNRQHDDYPFWGGASIQSAACSDGFAWTAGTTGNAMAGPPQRAPAQATRAARSTRSSPAD
jgi:hypothetical protein